MEATEERRTLLVVDASFDLGNALAVAALERGWEPFLAGNGEAALSILPGILGEGLVVVMTRGQPIPEAVRRAPFVVGAIRRPRHPEEAGELIRVLLGAAETVRPA